MTPARSFILAASLSGALAVMLGAFGAHALKAKLGLDAMQTFETGVRYQFYHTLALLAVALLLAHFDSAALRGAGWLFLLGMLLFSGSLYLLACRDVLGIADWRWLGPVTPLGGLCFIAGWLALFIGVLTAK